METVRNGYTWKQNASGLWAWFEDEKQVSYAYRQREEANYAFETSRLGTPESKTPEPANTPLRFTTPISFWQWAIQRPDCRIGKSKDGIWLAATVRQNGEVQLIVVGIDIPSKVNQDWCPITAFHDENGRIEHVFKEVDPYGE